jgi:hypothetical protein
MTMHVIYDPYYSDGYLLEAAAALAGASRSRPRGGRLHPGVLVCVYTALSAEAHINYAIYSAFDSKNERQRLLALELRSKLQYIPQLVTGGAVFDPARAPLGDLFALVDVRNKMVHAKPAKWEIGDAGGGLTISGEPTGVPLDRAALYLSSLSLSGCARARGADGLEGPVMAGARTAHSGRRAPRLAA